MPPDLLSSKCAFFKSALEAGAQCPEETLQRLSAVLLENSDGCQADKKSKTGLFPTPAPNSSKRGQKTTTVKKPVQRQVVRSEGESLSDREREFIARDVFNTALSALSSALKSRHEQKSSASGHAENDEGKALPASSNCLSERSPNKPPAKSKRLNASKTSAYPPPGAIASRGLENIADCGATSLRYLWKHGFKASSTSDNYSFDLEIAHLSFIRKILALDLIKNTRNELKSLRKRLNSINSFIVALSNSERNHATNKVNEKVISESRSAEDFTALIDFKACPFPDSAISIVTDFQILVLKTVFAAASSDEISKLADHLDFSSPNTLLVLLLGLGNIAETKEKAVRQLDSISQILLAACTKFGSKVGKGSRTDSILSPLTSFKLLSTALQARSHWMRICHHECDVASEILQPFSKCLLRLATKSRNEKSVYELAKRAATDLLRTLPTSNSKPSKQSKDSNNDPYDIYFVLSDWARSCSSLEEAENWIELCGKRQRGHTGFNLELSRCSLKLATLYLLNSDAADYEKLQNHLEAAIFSIGTEIEINHVGLQATVLDMVTLVKESLMFIQKAQKERKINQGSPAYPLYQLCQRVLRSEARRFETLMTDIEKQQKSATTASLDVLQETVTANSRLVVESILYYMTYDIKTDHPSWEVVDESLQDCFALLRTYSKQKRNSLNRFTCVEDAKSSLFVKLSNLYWMFYLRLREKIKTGNDDLFSAFKVVNRSCEVLRECCLYERISGSLSTKLEKLARICLENNELKSARRALFESLQSQINTESSADLSVATNDSSIHVLGQSGPQTVQLIGTLQSILDLDLKQLEEDGKLNESFDRLKCDPQLMGLILEWQLALLLKKPKTKRGSEGSKYLVSSIFQRLMQLYSESSHPLRRRRAILKMLHFQSTSSVSTDTDVFRLAEDCLSKELDGQLGNDTGLARYIDSITKSTKLLCMLSASSYWPQAVQDTLDGWKAMVEDCSSLSEVAQVMDDPIEWQERLEMLSDYQASRGYLTQQITTKTILLKLEQIKPNSTLTSQLTTIVDIGLNLLREGYYEAALSYVSKAGDNIGNSDSDIHLSLKYQVLQLEYHMAGNLIGECEKHVQESRLSFQNLCETLISSTSKTSAKIGAVTLAADCQLAHARYFFETGHCDQALILIKSSVTSLQRLWKSVASRKDMQNKLCSKDDNTERTFKALYPNEDKFTSSTEKRLDEPGGIASTDTTLWMILPRLFDSLMNLSKIYFFLGNLQDAIYHSELAQKLAEDLSSNILRARALRRIGDYKCRGKQLNDAKQLLSCALQTFSNEDTDHDLVRSYCSLGYYYRLYGDAFRELESYDNADNTLSNLLRQRHSNLENDQVEQKDQANDAMLKSLQHLRLDEKLRMTEANPRNGVTQKKIYPTKACKDANESHMESQVNNLKHPTRHIHLHNHINLLRAGSLLSQHDFEKSFSVLNQLGNISLLAKESEIWRCRLYAKSLVESALSSLSADPVYSMLSESAVALPSCNLLATNSAGSGNAHGSVISKSQSHKSRPAHGKNTTQFNNCDEAFHKLKQAFSVLETLPSEASRFSPIADIMQICSMFANVSLLQSIASDIRTCLVCPATVAHALELPRTVASMRERIAAEADKLKAGSNIIEWPNDNVSAKECAVPTREDFQREFIDLIPSNWIAVSITLDEEKQQLYFNRYEREKSPFVLRLPLVRQRSEDADETSFGLEDAKTELLQIIKESDSTVHGARDQPEELEKKGAKTKWWNERKALDARLKDLLANIEDLWLGGFKGIFSQHNHNPRLLIHFQKDFEQLLHKYLPSRSKSTKLSSPDNVVQLDSSIYELFVGLGQVDDDENLDEILTDLLYFVVDILQFHGERNAYDEIDFDALVVETIGALQSYHQAAEADTASHTDPNKHLILVLDKELHSFPWECLPCLSARSISRVTSLLDLRERILTMQKATVDCNGKYVISQIKGTYILNPSSDLSKTQLHFEGPLSALCATGWSNITQRAPSEDEFATALDTSNGQGITLYFGHGAGTQYIRRRRIGQLHRCNGDTTGAGCTTTLLFGCSSASLKEAGEFEPYGTPKSYLLAGAPALVGALWDVTDGDCDVFAKGVLSRWGLLQFPEGGESTEADAAKSSSIGAKRGKVRANATKPRATRTKEKDKDGDDSRMSLSDAVARSRADCYLSYLNGAAMVVYGVPVYLS